MTMKRHFSQEEAFPVIARLIVRSYGRTGNFVSHGELVDALIDDAVGSRLVQHACEVDDEKRTKRWWASNMVQWFSQKHTEEALDYANEFERQKTEDGWAYRPKNAGRQ